MITLRSLLEKTTKGLSYKRNLPTDAGGRPIYVTPAGGLRYLFRSMNNVDPALIDLAGEVVQKDDVVWDVGANVGLFAFTAAHFAQTKGKVFAFEADTWLIQLLRRSCKIQQNQVAPVEIIPVAIAESCDLRAFNIASRTRSCNYLDGYGQSEAGGIAERQVVMSVNLDWLGERLPKPNVLKIDVEGAEVEVLKGATQLLKETRPIVICEVGEENSHEVFKILDELNYSIYDGDIPKPNRTKLQMAPWGTLAIPNP